MKSTSQQCRIEQQGIALVIVLGFLVLLSGLAIAFFSSVTTELKSSQNYASGVSTRQLADSATSVVMGQIREATTREGAAWASQPGMIRVYGDGGTVSPAAEAFFKLYSSDNMVVTKKQITDGFNPSDDVPSDWDRQPAVFTDINAPVLVSEPPRPVFPVIDPRAYAKSVESPYKTDDENVEGFWYPESGINGLKGPAGGALNQRLPMPTKWLYVLRDGMLTTPSSSTGAVAKWSGLPASKMPTKENPIVGRIAFWTDDDTSKVNINTAAGYGLKIPTGYTENTYAGSFWDTPRVYSKFDVGQTNANDGSLKPGGGGLAATQPAQHEFQRYPGHPATTSLGAVFMSSLTSEQIYKLVPHVNGGGSMGGTVRLQRELDPSLKIKKDRLYASLDELLYAEPMGSADKRQINDEFIKANNVVTPEVLEKLKFFLTPNSRAPELNLFGRPRVAIWPLPEDDLNTQGPFDRAISFCSTIGTKKYIFTRSSPLSTTQDIEKQSTKSRNKNILTYLRTMTSNNIPGFGGNLNAKYGANRNAILGEIFDYIRIANLKDTTTEGRVVTWPLGQYAAGGIVAPSRVTGTAGFGRFPTLQEATVVFYCGGVTVAAGAKDSESKPITTDPFQGVVHNDDLAKITHRYIKAFVLFSTFNPMQGYAPLGRTRSLTDKTSLDPLTNERLNFEVKGLNSFSIGSSLGFLATATSECKVFPGQTYHGRNFGGYDGVMHTLQGNQGNYAFESKGNGVKVPFAQSTFDFSGGTIEVKMKIGTLDVQGITLKFEPGSGWPVPQRRYQLVNGGFVQGDQDGSKFNDLVSGKPKVGVESAQNFSDFSGKPGRISWSMKGGSEPQVSASQQPINYFGNAWRQLIQPGDVARSLVFGSAPSPVGPISEGDMRILLLTPKVGVELFKTHPDYFDSGLRFAQSIRTAEGSVYVVSGVQSWDIDISASKPSERKKATTETTQIGNHVTLGTGKRINSGKTISLPYSQRGNKGVDGVLRSDDQPGDWDTGIGTFADGAFAGKQDEGNVVFSYFDYNLQREIYPIPYFGTQAYEPPGDTFFSPNRQMPSAAMFGSLPSRPVDKRHWETLAFCPNTAGERHPGNVQLPRDHLLLDLFHMPVVEPYSISEPLSTAGRINLNYQIAPFSYIHRSTALRAAIQPLRVSAIPTTDWNKYKTGETVSGVAGPMRNNIRLFIDRDETIAGFDAFFEKYATDPNSGFFKSASQICERFLYPRGGNSDPKFVGPAYDASPPFNGEEQVRDFWANNALTGDNLREKPYVDLYPRVTTKSNTYTVHMRVQTLRQISRPTSEGYEQWNEGKDVVSGEYRGATTVERYVDPADSRFQTGTGSGVPVNPDTTSLEGLYRFRVVGSKQFSP